jgi:Saxitoxin biosynthesis operon protein SxtJ
MLKKEFTEITSTRKDCRNFGLSVGIVLLILGGFLFWKDRPTYPWFLGIGGALAFLGLVAPMILKPLQKPWMMFAVLLGFIMSRIILSILFFVVFTIIGRLARLFGAKLLDESFDRSATSHWRLRPHKVYDPIDDERQF